MGEHRSIACDDIAAKPRECGEARVVHVRGKTRPRDELYVGLAPDEQRVRNDEKDDETSDRAVDVHLRGGRGALAQEREALVRAHGEIRAVFVGADRDIDERPHPIFGQSGDGEHGFD